MGCVERIADLIRKSVKESLLGIKKATVGFSGGVDSSVIAKVSSEFIEVECVSVGVNNFKQAEKSAQLLGLPLIKVEIDVRERKKVEEIIGTSDFLQTSIALPFYFLCKSARTTEILTGQGADELFLGYQKYYSHPEKAKELQKQDLENMWEKNGKRDFLVASFFGKRLINPYLNEELIREVEKIPFSEKVSDPKNRKILLRKAAVVLGVPKEIAFAPKKAIQYSTGVSKVLKLKNIS